MVFKNGLISAPAGIGAWRKLELNRSESLTIKSVYEMLIKRATVDEKVSSSTFENGSCPRNPVRRTEDRDAGACELGGSSVRSSQPEVSIAVFSERSHLA